MPAAARARAALLIACSAWWAGASAACAPGFAPAPVPLAPAVTAAENLLAWYKFDAVPADGATLTNYGAGGAEFDATIHMQAGGIQQIVGGATDTSYLWPEDTLHGNFLTVPSEIFFRLDDVGYSIAFWMIDHKITDNDMLVMSGLGAIDTFASSNSGYFIKIYAPWANGVVYFDNYNADSDQHRVSAAAGIVAGQLTHMAFTRENIGDTEMKLRVYRDSVQILEETKPITMFSNADPAQSVFFIGYDIDANWLFRDKSLEDFRIYDRALTAAEVAAIYAGDTMASSTTIESAEPSASGACIGCLPGHASSNGTACVACRPGEYAALANATFCAPCGTGEQSFRGDTACFDAAAFLAATGCACP